MYIPRILLCGDVKNFLRELDGRDVDIVGRIRFKGAAERGQFVMPAHKAAADKFTLDEGDFRIFLDGDEISVDALRKILDGQADYIVVENHGEFLARFRELYALKLIDRVVTVPTLLTYARDGFFSPDNAVQIFNVIHATEFARVLDFDGYFAANDYHMVPDVNRKIDGIVGDVKFPALENFYGTIYPTVDACRYKHFDALLLTAERTPAEFIDALIDTDALSDNVLTFVRRGSDLERWFAENQNVFAQITATPAVNGSWLNVKKFAVKTFAAYVVTHKKISLDLPDGYRIIHAGHVLSTETFGELVDDAGENISRLNLYLNEVTALYWLWKHTRQSHVAFVHYRRFFTVDGQNILTAHEATEILREFDIIVNECKFGYVPERDWKIMLSGRKIADRALSSMRKFIALRQPDYLDAFDRVTGSFGVFCYEIFVTRQNIFDAYCAWLFSFIVDAAEYFLSAGEIDASDPNEYRAMSFLTEHLLTVWLLKNHLRIKPLPIIFRDV
ncbi:MAG: DUF4422 domain-containing protein [Selenomonadaceae bacterium]|nr:DUF4422 domain-containing protein [Selenomonadaceae bacterium]